MISYSSWFDDLVNEGYTNGTFNDRLFAFLGDQGYAGTIDDRLNAWLGNEGYTGVLGERLAKALRDSVVPYVPAPSCTVTLDEDGSIVSNFGATPFEVIDQENQVTSTVNDTEDRNASTEYFTPTWSGWRELEIHINEKEGGTAVNSILEISGGAGVSDVGTDAFGTGDRMTFRINGDDGSLEVMVNGSVLATETASDPANNDFLIAVGSGGVPVKYTWYADGSDQLHSTTNDWCGNTI